MRMTLVRTARQPTVGPTVERPHHPLSDERLSEAAKAHGEFEVVVTLRGQILPPLDPERGRWRIRTAEGQTTFLASSVLSVTSAKRDS